MNQAEREKTEANGEHIIRSVPSLKDRPARSGSSATGTLRDGGREAEGLWCKKEETGRGRGSGEEGIHDRPELANSVRL